MSFPPPTPKQARILWFSLTALAVTVLVFLLGLLVWGLGFALNRLSTVLLPVALGLVLAYILDPVVEFFVRKKLPRVWAIVLVFVLGLLVIGGALGAVIPGLVRESRKLILELPKNSEKIRLQAGDFIEHSSLSHLLPASWRESSIKLLSQTRPATSPAGTNVVETNLITSGATETNEPAAGQTNAPATFRAGVETPASEGGEPPNDFVVTVLKRVAQWVPTQLGKVRSWLESSVGFVLVPICLFYFLLEKERILRNWAHYLPIQESRAKEEAVFVLRAINDCMIVFFRGQVLVALCVGTLLAAGYLILGLNYAALLGLVAGVLGIVPYLGTIVSLVLALTVAAVQFGDWKHPLLVLGIAAAVKLLEDLVISPKIMGERSGLHPLTVILAVMIGASLLGGLLGAILAIPLTAVLRTLMFRYIWKHEPARKHAAKSK